MTPAGLPRRAVIGSGLVAALAACTGLPTETPIERGREVGRSVDDPIRVVVQGPVDGATPDQIVTGFLRASVAFDDDPSVAQEYLGGRARIQWRPHGVAIYEVGRQPTVKVSGSGDVRTADVSVPASAALDAEGHYRDLPAASPVRLRLTLRRVDGQWRVVDGLDDFGAVMTRGDFARYGSFDIPYGVPSGDATVVDRRWILQGSGLVTRLARAVVAEPPAYLRDAVVTALPPYASLVGAVTVNDGTATVQVTDHLMRADEHARRVVWARFVAALTQDREVRRVQVMAGGTPLAVDGLPDRPLTPDDVPMPTSTLSTDVAVIRRDEALTAVDPAGFDGGDAKAVSLRLPRVGDGWHHIALSVDTSEVAAVGGDGIEIARWRSGAPVPVPRFGTHLTPPAYDRRGVLWVGGEADRKPHLFALTAAGGGPVVIDVPWLAGRRVRAVRVADDGQRVLLLSSPTGGGPDRLDIAGVVRSGAAPVRLAAPREVAAGIRDIADATWVDGTTVAVLGRRRLDRPPRAVLLPLNDSPQELGEVPHGITITSYGSERDLVVVTSDGAVLRRTGGRFTALLEATDIALPGR